MMTSHVLETIGILIGLLLSNHSIGSAYQPEFAGPLINLSVAVGRDATFRCLVHHLGGYRVGWVKADTKAIQAIHEHVITHNPRVGVSHLSHTTWNLHIRSVQEEDRGQYMCQINTDPMKSQVGHLEVVVPPDFLPEETSGDVMLPEGGSVRLACRAKGHPPPTVQWRREDGQDIVIREPGGQRMKVQSFQGEVLKLLKVSRSEMGAYMCIASNGVPPTISKRIMVSVNFHPVIQVPNQLVGAPPGTDVILECYVEAFPVPINYWIRESGEMVVSNEKYSVQILTRSLFEVRMTMLVRDLEDADSGTYRCVAKNSVGEVDSSIRLYMIPGPTKRSQLPPLPPELPEEALIDIWSPLPPEDSFHFGKILQQFNTQQSKVFSTNLTSFSQGPIASVGSEHPGHKGNRVPDDPPLRNNFTPPVDINKAVSYKSNCYEIFVIMILLIFYFG